MMKRVLLLILVVLLMAGCSKEVAAPEATEAAVQATEPVSIYMANSSVEQQTDGAVKVFVPEADQYIGMGAMNGDVVLVSDLTKLTLVDGETGNLGTVLKVGETISCEGTDFTVSDKGVSYYRADGLELVFLNNQLQQVAKVDVPADISGKPCISHTNQELYYCTGKEIRALHLQTGIARLVKEQICESMELVASHLDGTMLACKVVAENGSESVIYLESVTGKTIDDINELTSLQTSADRYLAVWKESGMVEVMLVGAVDGTPQVLTMDEDLTAAFALNGAYRWYEENGALVVDFYDFATGTNSAQIQLVGVSAPISIANDGQYIWILANEGNKQLLYRWDVTLSPTGNTYSYLAPLYTRGNPDTKGLEQCAQRAKELEDKYGVYLHVGKDALNVTGDYELTDEFQPVVLKAMMDELEKGLAMFPEGFLQASLAKGSMHVSLVREIADDKDMVQFYDNGDAYIVLAASDRLLDQFYHGVYYVIDSHVLGNSRDLDNWKTLNPWSFDYDYHYYSYENHWNSDLLTAEYRYFVDTYAMTFPHEDRCRTFVYAMMDDTGGYFNTEAMQYKLWYLSQGIREAYGYEGNGVRYRWEQYLWW